MLEINASYHFRNIYITVIFPDTSLQKYVHMKFWKNYSS